MLDRSNSLFRSGGDDIPEGDSSDKAYINDGSLSSWNRDSDSASLPATFHHKFSKDNKLCTDGVDSEKLNQFRLQLHQLSKQKDGLMPKADGAFPTDWLNLAWDYQGLAEYVIRFIWPCPYPEELLPCISHQLEYLRSRLHDFPEISDVEKDKFRRLYVLAALGIIAKLKLITFCWTFVELKNNEDKSAVCHISEYKESTPANKNRRIETRDSSTDDCEHFDGAARDESRPLTKMPKLEKS